MKLIGGTMLIVLGTTLVIYNIKKFDLDYNRVKLIGSGVAIIILGLFLILQWFNVI